MAAGLSAFGGKDGSWAGVRICPSIFQEVYNPFLLILTPPPNTKHGR